MPDTVCFTLEVLTPVHIGDGNRKIRNIDFYTDRSQTHLVDLDLLTERVAEKNPGIVRELEYLDDQDTIGDFLQRHRELNTPDIVHRFPMKCVSKEILTCIRNGMGLPFIPGSSLKGALRTALLATWFEDLSPEEKEPLLQNVLHQKNANKADQTIMKALFGNSPNDNVMRALRVTDAHFQPQAVDLLETRVFNLGRDGGWFWKKTRHGAGDMRNVVEVLKPGRKAELSLALDQFLLGTSRLHFSRRLSPSPRDLIALVNAHSKRLLEAEMDFFEEHDPRGDLRGLFRQLDILRRTIPSDDSALVLRLGWGVGWKTITGNYIPDQRMEEFRRRFKLGRFGAPDFPKSRAIGFQNNRPEIQTGWVKLTVKED
ncbi:MAG: type III-A CRISPR-associated RAMP protein Csm5 [Fidelibacterota bacterium]